MAPDDARHPGGRRLDPAVPPAAAPTVLTSVESDRVLIRGYAIDELMGRVAFGDAVYLLLTGELPSPSISRLVSAVLTGLIDHGATPASMLTREASLTGLSLPRAVATGLLGFERHEVGNVTACRDLLDEALDLAGSSMLLASASTDLVEQLVQTDRIPPPGFAAGAPAADPRVTRLMQMAIELEADALYSQCLRAIEMALSRHPALAEESLPIAIDGAIAAVCGDLGLDPLVAEALLVISRVPGIVAHALEAGAQAQDDSARALRQASLRYVGPSERRLRDR